MEKRVTGIYAAVLLIGILYAIYAAASFHGNITGRTMEQGVVQWDDSMETEKKGSQYFYRRTLPTEGTGERVIVYNTVHMNLEVFIDGDKIYELKAEPDSAVKTTGNCWNIISLTEDDAGREIVFAVTPAYRDGKPKGDFYYGTYRDVEHKIFADRVLRVFLAGMILLSGRVMLVYGIFVVKTGQDARIIMQFAIFATMLGIWAVTETQLLDWFFPCSMIIVCLSHLMLMTMPIPFMLYLRNIYTDKESRLWDICCYMNCGVIAVRVILQVTGIYDLRETLLMTHVFLLLFVAVIVVMTIREITENEFTGRVKLNSICVMVILVSVVLELAIYHFGNMSTPLGSTGFLFYIVVMGVENIQRSRKLMAQARESMIYRKLAYTDELTGLANRTAFREDMENRMRQDKSTGAEKMLPTVVFMFDLNDLKKCNDTYGHDYGDTYIKMAANAIKKMFAQEGKCYRVGGDEFCAWTPYTSVDKINEKLKQFEQNIQELNDEGFVVPVSIAVGYAFYEEGRDGGGLYGTMKRADEMMYERKKQYKKQMD